MGKKAPNGMISEMVSALETARRILVADRRQLWMDFTVPPERSWMQMNAFERKMIKRLDRAIVKIDYALR